MGKVVSHMTISLDGFIADPQDGVAELSGWYEAGTMTVPQRRRTLVVHGR